MLNFAGGWHSEVDSFLEYLIKIFHYQADNITQGYADFWLTAAQSTAENIALHPFGFEDLTFISQLDENGVITFTMDDYSCFSGGNFLLGCKVLGIDSLCDLGIAAADGCHQTYNTTATGLGPLFWGWFDDTNNTYPPDPDVDIDNGYRRQGAANGEFVVNGNEEWASFPESLESWFYAYRITGDPRWADYAWDMFLSINETARNSVAFATVNNVGMPFGESQSNSLDSFFFAEVLKYLYLSFADPGTIDLGQWVFNTECHPVQVQCTPQEGA
jgi:mannosyl-oligosaccharide alpha-1,2-mannosidase